MGKSSDEFVRNTGQANKNLRNSVQAARAIGFELAGANTKMVGVATAAASFAENLAKASKNARLVAGATGIGLVVAAIGSAWALTVGWKETTKEIADKMRGIARETAQINAKAGGDQRLATELDITAAMEDELETLRKQESTVRTMIATAGKKLGLKFDDSEYRKLEDAIKSKADAQRKALSAERQRKAEDKLFDVATDTGQIYSGMKGSRQAAYGAIATEYRRRVTENIRNDQGFDRSQRIAIATQTERWYEAAMLEVDFNEIKPIADQLGQGFATALADGIASGIQKGDLGAAFRGITGGFLIAIGDTMQSIGTKALLATSLIMKAVAFLGTPAGIPAAIALIAAGGLVKGLGQSIASSSPGRSAGGGSSSYGSGYGNTTFVGVVNPSGGTNVGNLRALPPMQFTVIGPNDPTVQRTIAEIVINAQTRGLLKSAA